MTTTFDIDEIARLLAGEETSGPWWNEGCEIFYLNDSGQRCTLIYGEGGHGEHDAALIVTLHNSAPAMIAELRELRAKNAQSVAHRNFPTKSPTASERARIMVEVTDEVRDAAAEYWNSMADEWNPWTDISGDEQNATIEAFARIYQRGKMEGARLDKVMRGPDNGVNCPLCGVRLPAGYSSECPDCGDNGIAISTPAKIVGEG